MTYNISNILWQQVLVGRAPNYARQVGELVADHLERGQLGDAIELFRTRPRRGRKEDDGSDEAVVFLRQAEVGQSGRRFFRVTAHRRRVVEDRRVAVEHLDGDVHHVLHHLVREKASYSIAHYFLAEAGLGSFQPK